MRGTFLRRMEEKVRITGTREESPANLSSEEQAFFTELPNGTVQYEQDAISIIIKEDRTPRLTPQGFVVQELRYIGNITPPNYLIRINDQVTRFPRSSSEPRGSSNEDIQVLTVVNVQIEPRIRGTDILQLQLSGQPRPTR